MSVLSVLMFLRRSVSFHGGMCVYVWLTVCMALKVCFSPVGGLREKWLCFEFEGKKEVRIIWAKTWWVVGWVQQLRGWGSTRSWATHCSQDNNNNQLQSGWRNSEYCLTAHGGRCLTTHTHRRLFSCLWALQYLQSLVMQPAISFWQTHF